MKSSELSEWLAVYCGGVVMERNEYQDVFQGSSLGNQLNGSIILTHENTKGGDPAFGLVRLASANFELSMP